MQAAMAVAKAYDRPDTAHDARVRKFNTIDWIAMILLIVGGLNWGLVAIAQFDLGDSGAQLTTGRSPNAGQSLAETAELLERLSAGPSASGVPPSAAARRNSSQLTVGASPSWGMATKLV